MAWADFWLSRIGLLVAAGVLLVAAAALLPALAPRSQEAAAARVADEVAQKAAALSGALPGSVERVAIPEEVEVEVGPERVAAKTAPYRVVRSLLRPLYGPTRFGAGGAALEDRMAQDCRNNSSDRCADDGLQRVRDEFLRFPFRPVGRVFLLERLGPWTRDSVFVSEPGRAFFRAGAELRRDAEGGLLQRVEVSHLGGPPLNVQGTELKVWSGKESLASIPLPVSTGVEGTRGVGGVFHIWNASGPLWEVGESGWVNIARGRRALAPGDPVRIELWNATGLLARADAVVEDRR